MSKRTKKTEAKVAEVIVDNANVVDTVVSETTAEDTGVDISEMMLDATDETDTSDESEVTDEQESEVTETKDDTSEVTDEQESVVVLAYEDIGLHPYVILSDYKLKVTAAAAKAITDKKITEQLTPKDIECIAAFKYWTRNGNNFSLDVKE